MTRIRLIALALFAMFALSAIGAASALAADGEGEPDEFEVAKSPFSAHSTTTQTFTVNAGKVECKKATFEAAPGVGNHPTIETKSVVYSECKAFGVEAKIKFEGCQYKFNAPKDAEAESKNEIKHTGTVNIVCPEGKTIVIQAGTCTVTVPTQGPLSSINYKLIGTANTVIEANVKGIEYTEIGANCPNIVKSPETFKNGTYVGNVEVEGVMIN